MTILPMVTFQENQWDTRLTYQGLLMITKSTIITACLCLLVQTPSFAGVYKWVDENGQVHYGEQPVGADAEKVKIRQNETTKPRTLKKAEDAICIDTTNMTIEQVVDEVIKQVRGSS